MTAPEEINTLAASPELCRALAIRLAQAHTGRAKVLLLDGASEAEWGTVANLRFEKIPDRDASALCRTIGESEERIAALVVRAGWERDFGFKRFAKRARELASAEGALLIWDESAAGIVQPDDREWYGVRPDLRCHRTEDGSGAMRISGRPELWKKKQAAEQGEGS